VVFSAKADGLQIALVLSHHHSNAELVDIRR
jgi:hypothetical protein